MAAPPPVATQGGDHVSSPLSKPSSPRKATSRAQSPSKAGRTEWVMLTPSPGPAAYNPSTQAVMTASERAVFGTAYREQEEKRFVSSLHNATLPNAATPGPGAYRTAENRLLRNDRGAHFGSAPQRLDVSREALGVPGPQYDLPSTLSPQAVGFGSPTTTLARPSPRPGSPMRDSRTLPQERFPLENVDTPGPDSYLLIPVEKMSQHASSPRHGFGRATREAATRSQISPQQLAADATVSTAFDTPGPLYDVRAPSASVGAVFSRGPAHFSPELGGNSKGPYLGRLHADANKGIESPGPGSYALGTTLHSAGAGKFGPPSPSKANKHQDIEVPGPGAHNPNFAALSVRPTSSAFSMAANIRTDFTAFSPDTPGPAAYGLPSPDRASTKLSAPAFTMGSAAGGRLSYVQRRDGPAPDSYGRPDDPRDKSPVKKGFSFGLRERTKSATSVITNRYHGPLAAQEGMCHDSPGPAAYELPSPVAARSQSPATRFGTSGRDAGSKLYFSHAHSAAEGYGLSSPGPGCYNITESLGLGSPNRFKTKVAPKFGTSARFNDKVSTK